MSASPKAQLDRRAEARHEPGWAQAALADPDTRYLISRATTHLVRRDPGAQIAFLGPEHPLIAALDPQRLVLLGWFEGRRCVLVDLPADTELSVPGASFEELRSLVPLLPEGQAQLLVYCAGTAGVAFASASLRRVRCTDRGAQRRPRARLHQQQLRCRILSAHRSGHHRAGERRQARAARAPAQLGARALLGAGGIRRGRREPGGRGGARGRRGDRRHRSAGCATSPRSPGRFRPR